MTGSAGQRRVPAAFLEQLRVPLPPIEEQRRIAAILDQADALRAKRRAAATLTGDLANALFHQLFGDFAAYDVHPLRDLAEAVSGLTKGRKLNGQQTRPVPYLAVANVQAGHLQLDSVKEISATEDEISRLALQAGDLVLTEGGDPDKLGRGTIWRGEIPLMLHQNHIFRVRIRPSVALLPKYLSAFVAGSSARRYFLSCAKQTTGIASINMTQLKALPVRVPPIALQQDYVALLAAVKQHRQASRIQERDIEGLCASLCSRAFAGGL